MRERGKRAYARVRVHTYLCNLSYFVCVRVWACGRVCMHALIYPYIWI